MIVFRLFAPERQFEVAFSITMAMAAAGIAAAPGKDGHDVVPKRDGEFLSWGGGAWEQENSKTPEDLEETVHPPERSYQAGKVPSVKFRVNQPLPGKSVRGVADSGVLK